MTYKSSSGANELTLHVPMTWTSHHHTSMFYPLTDPARQQDSDEYEVE